MGAKQFDTRTNPQTNQRVTAQHSDELRLRLVRNNDDFQQIDTAGINWGKPVRLPPKTDSILLRAEFGRNKSKFLSLSLVGDERDALIGTDEAQLIEKPTALMGDDVAAPIHDKLFSIYFNFSGDQAENGAKSVRSSKRDDSDGNMSDKTRLDF